jgi:hypothetical protein
VFALLLSGTVHAQQVPDFGLTFRGRLEWITAAQATFPRSSEVNPRNLVLSIPQASARTELRPDLRLEGGSIQFVARPRLLLEGSAANVDGSWQAFKGEGSVIWLDLFGSWCISDWLTVAYGLQNFQWGPAELLSPSNRIFHETAFARDPLYFVRGKNLLRVNLSAGKSLSAVLLAELLDNGAEPFVAGTKFDPKAALKVEWAAESGRGYLGITGGGGKVARGYFGEYGSVEVVAGLSLYFDAVHQAGSDAWVPTEQANGDVAFTQAHRLDGLQTLVVGGARYTFRDGSDIRLEYVFDQAGWSRDQLALANRAAAAFPPHPDQAAVVAAWQRPGFELIGRHLAYLSMSFIELPPWKRTKLQVRAMEALEDASTAVFGTVSYNATESAVVFVSASWSWGPPDSALARAVQGMVVAGAVMSW